MPLYEKYVYGTSDNYDTFKNSLKIKIPENFNFAYDVVDVLAEEQGGKCAMVWTNAQGGERRFTFAEFKEKSDKTASFLQTLGIGKGDGVMVMLKRHYEFWYTILALHKLGAVGIPATHLLTTKDIIYRCDAANVQAIICTADDNIADHVDAAEGQCKTLKHKVIVGGPAREGWIPFDEGLKNAPAFERPTGPQATQNSDISLLYFTSGTTGNPKMVAHDFLYPLGHIVTAVYWQNVTPDSLHLTVADTGWAKAVWGKLYGQWLAEGCVFVYDYDKFEPAKMLSAISRYKVTNFCAPPTIYRYFIKEDLSKYDLSALRYCTIAGEPLNPEIYEQFLKATGIKLMEAFGQTECVVMIGNFLGMEPRPGSMGKPSPFFNIALLGENDTPCESGAIGELCIDTENGVPLGMFHGYYHDDELTQSVWPNRYYHTGDMAWRDEAGYYWYVGRSDDVIKSSGYRIGPFEVESALQEHPAVLENAVTGVPHPDRGQVVKATVVLATGYEPSEELKKELQDHVKKVTAPYKYPRLIEFVPEMPKTISGKIRRVELRERDAQKAKQQQD